MRCDECRFDNAKLVKPVGRLPVAAAAEGTPAANGLPGANLGKTITATDGTKIFYKDWGTGKPVVFSHGWPLSADAWDAQMLFLGMKGYRVIAYDRRSHGRTEQTWTGNDMDTYADDLAMLAAKILPKAKLKIVAGGPHGMCTTMADTINASLLAFLKS